MDRRSFLVHTGGALGAGLVAQLAEAAPTVPAPAKDPWAEVRAQFNLARDRVHLASFFFATHPAPVREAIETHRRGFDADPYSYFYEMVERAETGLVRAAADYLGTAPGDTAFTDSTTMGLGLLYGGIRLKPGQEVLSTPHEHYSTITALALRARRDGVVVRQVSLYDDPAQATEAQLVERLMKGVTPKTRLVAVTWVHSVSGVKLPIRAIADALAKVNGSRGDDDRALLAVDGVHGFAAEVTDPKQLGCDFLVSGCHKWLFGPRGTGLVWGKPDAWASAQATIPTFDYRAYRMFEKELPEAPIPLPAQMTPGGFHSFEHRWALADAFRFHQSLGKAKVADRIHALNTQFKEGAAKLPRVKLRTPMSVSVSAGINCFEIDGQEPKEVVARLKERGFYCSVTPYATHYVRASFGVLNTPEDVDATLKALRTLVG